MLSDKDIKSALNSGGITIENFDPHRLQPASYDVLLGSDFLVFDKHKIDIIDPKKPMQEQMRKITIADDDCFVLHPHDFALGVVHDFIGVSKEYSCEVMGKSSLARLGLIIHTTAGFIDPGNSLNITLEFFNTNSLPIKLYPKMKVAQIAFTKLSSPSERPYGHPELNSKYLGDRKISVSKMNRNW